MRTLVVSISVVAFSVVIAAQQVAGPAVTPTNNAPNPYRTIEGWAKVPEARAWGSTSAVDIDRDGHSIWVAERCGANTCWNQAEQKMSALDPVLEFDPSGKLVKSFGAGLIVFPHGIHVDADGNVWVTDGQDNLPRRARGAAATDPLPAPPARIIGHQILKFSPDGTLLLTLGKPGGNQPGQAVDPSSFYQPNDVITNSRGEIFVCEGHSDSSPARISKFDKSGKFIKQIGQRGSGPGEFIQPHAFAFDSKGRLFVADRSNNRIQIFDQNLNLLEVGWQQYSRISGLWIDKDDTLFAADSESGSVAPDRASWKRGIRIGSIRDGANGAIRAFIPDPATAPPSTSAAEGVAVDVNGNIYGAEVGPRALKRYVNAQLSPQAQPSNSWIGLWESDAKSNGGIGTAIEFRADGTYSTSPTVLVDSFYRVVGNRMLIGDTMPAANADVSNAAQITFKDNQMVFGSPDGRMTINKERVGEAQSAATPVVGVWRYQHPAGGIAFERYTADGRISLRLAMAPESGRYTTNGGSLALTSDKSGSSSKLTGTVAGDVLTIADGARAVSYDRAAGGSWYPIKK